MARSATVPAAQPGIVNAGQRRAAVARARERQRRAADIQQSGGSRHHSGRVRARLRDVDPNAPRAENLWRVNWYNGPDRAQWVDHPAHLVLPEALTGVKAPIVVLLGAAFR